MKKVVKRILPRHGSVIVTGIKRERKYRENLLRLTIAIVVVPFIILFVMGVVDPNLHHGDVTRNNDKRFHSGHHYGQEEIPGYSEFNCGQGEEKGGLGIGCQMKGRLEEALPKLRVQRGRHDNQRQLRIFDFHRTGVKWDTLTDQYNVCLATQSTIERIYWLPNTLRHWNGPLSLALYVTYVEEWLVWSLFSCYLTHCHDGFSDRVSVHIVFPTKALNHSQALSLSAEVLAQWNVTRLEEVAWTLLKPENNEGKSCPDPKTYLNLLLRRFPTLDKTKLAWKEVYPQNHMRNIARKGCASPWTMSVDVDVIPRKGMAEMLQQFYVAQHNLDGNPLCEKCAFVIPIFELNETFPFPSNKGELIKYFMNGDARPYHGVTFPPAQFATNYARWIATAQEDDAGTSAEIAHDIGDPMGRYEPFYLSPDNISPFDERMIGYGFTRNSQVREAVAAGWKFKVISPPFLIHWGLFNSKTEQLSPKKNGVGKNVRWEQMQANKILYDKMERELKFKRKEGLL